MHVAHKENILALQTYTRGSYVMTYDNTITTTLDPKVPGKVLISWKKPMLKKSGKTVGAPRFAYKLVVTFDDRYDVSGEDFVRDEFTPIDKWVVSATSYTYSRVLTNNDVNDITGYPINVQVYIYNLEMFGTVNTGSAAALNRIVYSTLPNYSSKKLLAPHVPAIRLHQVEQKSGITIAASRPDSYASKYPLVTSEHVGNADLDWLFYEDIEANQTSSSSDKQLAVHIRDSGSYNHTILINNQSVSSTDHEIFQLSINTPYGAYLEGDIMGADPFAPVIDGTSAFFDNLTKSYDIRYRKNVGAGSSSQWTTLDATQAILISSIPTSNTILFAINKLAGSLPYGYGDYEISVAARIKGSQIVPKDGTGAPTLATTAFGQYTSLKFRVERPVQKVYFMSEYGSLANAGFGSNMASGYVESAYGKYAYDYDENGKFASSLYNTTAVVRDISKNVDMVSSATKSHMTANGPYQVAFIHPPLGDIVNALSVTKIPTAKTVVAGILAGATAFLAKYPDATVYITEMPMFGIKGRSSGEKLPLATSFANLPSSMTSGVIQATPSASRQSTLSRIAYTIDQVNVLLRQTFNVMTNATSDPNFLGRTGQEYSFTTYVNKYSTDYRDRVVLIGGPVFSIERTVGGTADGTPTQSSRVPTAPISAIVPRIKTRVSK